MQMEHMPSNSIDTGPSGVQHEKKLEMHNIGTNTVTIAQPIIDKATTKYQIKSHSRINVAGHEQ